MILRGPFDLIQLCRYMAWVHSSVYYCFKTPRFMSLTTNPNLEYDSAAGDIYKIYKRGCAGKKRVISRSAGYAEREDREKG